MTNNERDTHFANAAKVLMSRLNTEGFDEDGYRSGETTQQIIAQFLYDFAGHNAESLDPLTPGTDSAYVAWLASRVESIPDIPDLTKTKGLLL